jgi:hypothetical protein
LNCSPLGAASFACGKLAIVLLRVCAPEVKKKFRDVRKEKHDDEFPKNFLTRSEGTVAQAYKSLHKTNRFMEGEEITACR